MSVQITTPERHKVLGYSTTLNDVYYASEVKEVCLLHSIQTNVYFQELRSSPKIATKVIFSYQMYKHILHAVVL
jgi:hypothetical protein